MTRTTLVAALAVALCCASGGAFADTYASAFVGIGAGSNGGSISDPLSASRSGALNDSSLNATASASADLASGSMHALVSGEAFTCCFTSGFGGANAKLSDSFVVHGPTPTVTVTLQLAIDGTFAVSGPGPGSTNDHLNGYLMLHGGLEDGGSSALSLDRFYQVSSDGTVFNDYANGSVTGSAGSFLDKTLTDVDALLVVTAVMKTGQPLNFEARLSAANTVAAPFLLSTADFSHTAQLALLLPDGYTFTSSSGVLLSDVPTPAVPEPGVGTLLAAGLAGVWGVMRRRRA